MTLEGWVDVMYALLDTWGDTWPSALFIYFYFVSLIMVGSFFVLNLFMAVVYDEYEEAEAAQTQRDKDEEEAETAEEATAVAVAGNGTIHPEGNADAEAEPEAELDEMGEKIIPPWSNGAIPMAFYNLVSKKEFGHFITVLILLNTLCLALESYSMKDNETFINFLEVMNQIFTWSFTAEMVFKVIGLGFRGYASDNFNIFDFVIVTLSLVEFGIESSGGEGAGGVSALRAFRLMRVFKLARNWTSLQLLLNTIMESVIDVGNCSVLLAVVIFIFSLLGMQLFGGQLTEEKFDGEQPMAHFDSFWWSLVTVFQVLTGENWNDVVYNCMHGVGWAIPTIYFSLLNIVGTYLILNLFLAILLANFEEDDEEESPEVKYSAKVTPAGGGPDAAGGHKIVDLDEDPTNIPDEEESYEMVGKAFFVMDPENPIRKGCFWLISQKPFDNFILVLIGISSLALAIEEPYVGVCKEIPSGQTVDGVESYYEFGQVLYINMRSRY